MVRYSRQNMVGNSRRQHFFPHMSYIWSKGGDGYEAGRTVLQAEKANGGVPKKSDGAEVPAEDHHLGDRG